MCLLQVISPGEVSFQAGCSAPDVRSLITTTMKEVGGSVCAEGVFRGCAEGGTSLALLTSIALYGHTAGVRHRVIDTHKGVTEKQVHP